MWAFSWDECKLLSVWFVFNTETWSQARKSLFVTNSQKKQTTETTCILNALYTSPYINPFTLLYNKGISHNLIGKCYEYPNRMSCTRPVVNSEYLTNSVHINALHLGPSPHSEQSRGDDWLCEVQRKLSNTKDGQMSNAICGGGQQVTTGEQQQLSCGDRGRTSPHMQEDRTRATLAQ